MRSDEELADAIRDGILLRTMWLDPDQFTVTVVDGVASITGHVERRSIAAMVEHAVSMVPGIVTVAADLTWAVDDRETERTPLDGFVPMIPR